MSPARGPRALRVLAAEHWKRSLAIVAVVLVALGIAAGAGGGSFVDDFKTPGTESQSAIDVLNERFPAESGDAANVVFASLRLGQPDDGNDRAGSTTRVAYDRLAEGFGPGFNGPLVLAATTPSDGSGKTTLSRI